MPDEQAFLTLIQSCSNNMNSLNSSQPVKLPYHEDNFSIQKISNLVSIWNHKLFSTFLGLKRINAMLTKPAINNGPTMKISSVAENSQVQLDHPKYRSKLSQHVQIILRNIDASMFTAIKAAQTNYRSVFSL